MTKADLHEKLAASRQIAAIATAFFLPFSTSGQAIAVSIFAVLALLTLDRAHFVATMRHPAAWLPVALFAMLLIGTLWSMQPLSGAMKWLGPYAKLLLIPLVMATAFTPKQALYIGYGFLAACVMVLLLSWAAFLWPTGPWLWFKSPGIPFKDNAVQSGCFALCAFALAIGAIHMRKRDKRSMTAMAALALLFFADIFLIYPSKTGVIAALALLGLLTIHADGWRPRLVIAVVALVVMAIALAFSPQAQKRIGEVTANIGATQKSGAQQRIEEVKSNIVPPPEATQKSGEAIPHAAPPQEAHHIAEVASNISANNDKSPPNSDAISTGARIDFWKKALVFVKQAPLFGHGTGSIRPLYQTVEAAQPSVLGEATADPHNQTLHVVLQIGIVGGILLWAMWIAHGRLFWARDIVCVFGQAIVLQNVIGGLFNSHISAVTQGMLYCLMVGLFAALVMQRRVSAPA